MAADEYCVFRVALSVSTKWSRLDFRSQVESTLIETASQIIDRNHKQVLRLLHSSNFHRAPWPHRECIADPIADLLRDKNLALAGQFLYPRSQIDGVADDAVVRASPRANMACGSGSAVDADATLKREV